MCVCVCVFLACCSDVNQHDAACASAPHQYDEACSLALIAQLGVPQSYIASCMGNHGFLADATIPALDEDRQWMTDFVPFPPPELFVSGERGTKETGKGSEQL